MKRSLLQRCKYFPPLRQNLTNKPRDVKSDALIKTIGTGRTAKELITELGGQKAGVRTANDVLGMLDVRSFI
jgi:hypothetical protein